MFVLGLIGFKKPLTEGLDPIKNLGTIKVYNHKVPLNKSEGVPTEIVALCYSRISASHADFCSGFTSREKPFL